MTDQIKNEEIDFYDEIKSLFEQNYNGFLKPLVTISYDQSNRESVSTSSQEMYDYDLLIEKKVGTQHLKSPDALYFSGRNVWFIEFKNGYLDTDVKKMELKLKGIEGCYIGFYELIEMIRPGTEFKELMDLKISYFVVYNAVKNKYFEPNRSKRSNKNRNYKQNKSRKNSKNQTQNQEMQHQYDEKNKTHRYRVKNRILFLPEKVGLQRYKGTFYNNTGMISDSLFEKKLLNKICSLP